MRSHFGIATSDWIPCKNERQGQMEPGTIIASGSIKTVVREYYSSAHAPSLMRIYERLIHHGRFCNTKLNLSLSSECNFNKNFNFVYQRSVSTVHGIIYCTVRNESKSASYIYKRATNVARM